ncbi:MAG: hypothetical protein HN764_00930 [Gammaproteobacteria bacterium]|jgi:hypothetical protein|nr:hypothetical protein [Gammaproteobacteria bacterium]
MRRYCVNLLALIAIFISGIVFSAEGEGEAEFELDTEVLEVQWQVYQIRFFYRGLTAYYTCGGIEGVLRRLLLLLGARYDARVETNCIDSRNLRNDSVRKLRRAQIVKLAFAMPVPADKTDTSREIMSAKWQETSITGNLARYLSAADCELLQQFQRDVLPLLMVKNKVKNLHCTDNQHNIDFMKNRRSLRMKMTALKVIEKTELEEGRNNSK